MNLVVRNLWVIENLTIKLITLLLQSDCYQDADNVSRDLLGGKKFEETFKLVELLVLDFCCLPMELKHHQPKPLKSGGCSSFC